MNYAVFDPVLAEWSISRSIPLQMKYRDEDVRSFEIVGKVSKRQFQLWIDPADINGRTRVHAWDRKRWRKSFDATLFTLAKALDSALDEIEQQDQGSKP